MTEEEKQSRQSPELVDSENTILLPRRQQHSEYYYDILSALYDSDRGAKKVDTSSLRKEHAFADLIVMVKKVDDFFQQVGKVEILGSKLSLVNHQEELVFSTYLLRSPHRDTTKLFTSLESAITIFGSENLVAAKQALAEIGHVLSEKMSEVLEKRMKYAESPLGASQLPNGKSVYDDGNLPLLLSTHNPLQRDYQRLLWKAVSDSTGYSDLPDFSPEATKLILNSNQVVTVGKGSERYHFVIKGRSASLNSEFEPRNKVLAAELSQHARSYANIAQLLLSCQSEQMSQRLSPARLQFIDIATETTKLNGSFLHEFYASLKSIVLDVKHADGKDLQAVREKLESGQSYFEWLPQLIKDELTTLLNNPEIGPKPKQGDFLALKTSLETTVTWDVQRLQLLLHIFPDNHELLANQDFALWRVVKQDVDTLLHKKHLTVMAKIRQVLSKPATAFSFMKNDTQSSPDPEEYNPHTKLEPISRKGELFSQLLEKARQLGYLNLGDKDLKHAYYVGSTHRVLMIARNDGKDKVFFFSSIPFTKNGAGTSLENVSLVGEEALQASYFFNPLIDLNIHHQPDLQIYSQETKSSFKKFLYLLADASKKSRKN